MKIRVYRHSDETAVVSLWQACGLIKSQNNPLEDIKRKASVQPELFLVGTKAGQIVATIMAGYEGHRGWLNYLAVAPDQRLQGIGRKMVMEAEKQLHALGCPKINLQVRTSNVEAVAFYRKIGFVEDAVVSLGKPLTREIHSKE